MQSTNGPKVLLLDIETSPLLSYTWGMFDQNIALNQIHKDWHILSFACKWLGDPPSKVIYMDQSKEKNIEDDSKLLKRVWELLDECDIVLTQNGKNFDIKKLNARFALNGFKPYSSVRHIDTLLLAKKHFGFTSNKLEYMTDKLCVKYKKIKHAKFGGFELWKACLQGNQKAWKEMKKYNIYDILSLEELYKRLIPWDNTVNFNVYGDSTAAICTCGSKDFVKNGYAYTSKGKYRRFQCRKCGSELKQSQNLLSPLKRKSLKVGTSR